MKKCYAMLTLLLVSWDLSEPIRCILTELSEPIRCILTDLLKSAEEAVLLSLHYKM